MGIFWDVRRPRAKLAQQTKAFQTHHVPLTMYPAHHYLPSLSLLNLHLTSTDLLPHSGAASVRRIPHFGTRAAAGQPL
eukprot:350897-Prymnesium_polylepis.1